jgi:hypothetical protein
MPTAAKSRPSRVPQDYAVVGVGGPPTPWASGAGPLASMRLLGPRCPDGTDNVVLSYQAVSRDA